ncbi:hypothetical protein FXV83_16195 [Bradyrhizobium hipponense]|uniref:Uncharacterized protein n=1 Tax=Bradyrhizobium hipponense TaxID=2605638 RepID=A0A5S4YQ24_9BRAD|nr:hypothetical protein [Bradyrhizobium hipponense]TYO65475.1 hypothetical protein FXV83_16195 [Bradyrhizobium hipponense]
MENVTAILEGLIDRHGLTHVVTGLSLICSEKAEHLRHNWQDGTSAKAWDVDAKTLEKAAHLICSDAK